MCVNLCASLHLRACMQQNNGLLSAALITREPALEKEVVVDIVVASVAVQILAHLVILPCCWVEPLSGMMQHCNTLIYASSHMHQHECGCLLHFRFPCACLSSYLGLNSGVCLSLSVSRDYLGRCCMLSTSKTAPGNLLGRCISKSPFVHDCTDWRAKNLPPYSLTHSSLPPSPAVPLARSLQPRRSLVTVM